jgi:hypothetical protein
MLIGDSGIVHYVGYAFALAAQQKANDLQAQGGDKVIACRVSTVEDFNAALTQNGFINGDVHYFGHSGLLGFMAGGSIAAVASMLFVGQGSGSDANIFYNNVNQLCNAQSGCNVNSFLSTTTTAIRLNGCQAGQRVYDYYAQGPTSIAQLISNQLQRGVYAYEVGTYFSSKPAATDPYFDGKGRYAPSELPVYMVPAGVPGHKPGPIPFTSH